MSSPIEQYALIGDTETAALVSRQGSIDWFCAPRFDSAACLAALLGTKDHGRWALAPVGRSVEVSRRYQGDSLLLETTFVTGTGTAVLVDGMPVRGRTVPAAPSRPAPLAAPLADPQVDPRGGSPGAAGSDASPSIVRVVTCTEGEVTMRTELSVRFDYGAIVPWVRSLDGGFTAVGGADALVVRSDVPLEGADLQHHATFTLAAGETARFSLTWFPSHLAPPPAFDIDASLEVARRWWQGWADRCTYRGPWREAVVRSLLTLKALTFAPTGGIVAAPTTSLPEWIGSVRNWDYRYCWLRDATFTLTALLDAGYDEEAARWSDWLRRAVAGSPEKMQIMYGVGGERRLTEYEVPWLPGYGGSAPVRVGNAASEQFQLDVYGEVMDMFVTAERRRLEPVGPGDGSSGGLAPAVGPAPPRAGGDGVVDLARFLVEHVRQVWAEPDDGIWEMRGPRRHFVHSKVMAWVAIDRWVKLIGHLGLDDDPAPWIALRDEIHDQVCTRGWDESIGSFTQSYGSGTLDASLLMLALVGFLPPDDPRIVGTVDAVQRELVVDGFVLRYRTDATGDGSTGDDSTTRAAGSTGGADSTGGPSHPTGDADLAVDGLPRGEGSFLLTTFWLVDNLALLGRRDEAEAGFTRLLGLANDVGLLSEEYDTASGRLLGNFPQAFSHVGLLTSAFNLAAPPTARGGAHRAQERFAPPAAGPIPG